MPANSGGGREHTFTFRTQLATGYQSIMSSQVIIGTAIQASNVCYAQYVSGYVYLRNDAGTAWLGPVVAGTTATLANSQCTITNPVATGSGTLLDLILPLSFSTAFNGPKSIWQNAASAPGANSGWQPVGTWTVQ
jgi:hypothetical protein